MTKCHEFCEPTSKSLFNKLCIYEWLGMWWNNNLKIVRIHKFVKNAEQLKERTSTKRTTKWWRWEMSPATVMTNDDFQTLSLRHLQNSGYCFDQYSSTHFFFLIEYWLLVLSSRWEWIGNLSLKCHCLDEVLRIQNMLKQRNKYTPRLNKASVHETSVLSASR